MNTKNNKKTRLRHKYKPVRHSKEDTTRLLASDRKLKDAYNALENEFRLLDILLTARRKAGISKL